MLTPITLPESISSAGTLIYDTVSIPWLLLSNENTEALCSFPTPFSFSVGMLLIRLRGFFGKAMASCFSTSASTAVISPGPEILRNFVPCLHSSFTGSCKASRLTPSFTMFSRNILLKASLFLCAKQRFYFPVFTPFSWCYAQLSKASLAAFRQPSKLCTALFFLHSSHFFYLSTWHIRPSSYCHFHDILFFSNPLFHGFSAIIIPVEVHIYDDSV